ncbi:RNA 2',3'-cyclic phosphodiesterase [Bacillus sp. DTU_2020_1000418_1_SI_GHA_SEK_038]|uniref:RNA 2',3'-cyclic phosphodiesterase n=1 Tax=Bacillus sp. DTU_2020_1000418_1_SI_GHA_SEK_038 TaxID=3077585 RepID=UPI0028F0757B|nr:RNA 2',3'-cyclic phosphodiesterase [Bacillus sp. DTU_2020_1000418_1_SI_GHA_SEK_038]WNS74650.1 RNA 2',3'-cyclic phosphodiesterase [Bacillus sp. DTU_2020_1000418_1_SI_GHA_SEK_038]
MEKKTHFFYALSLPSETKLKIKEECSIIKKNLPFQRWVHHEDLHITLAFLGSAEKEMLLASQALVKKGLKDQRAFNLQIHELGMFGRGDSPRIFWADTKKEEKLYTIRDIVFSACTEAGFKLETRSFKPHITLARKWRGDSPFHISMLNENNPFKDSPLSFTANEVVLYQTHLDKSPKYERISIFPLADE